MKVSSYIYGAAGHNEHGNLDFAVRAKAITVDEKEEYERRTFELLGESRIVGVFPNDIQRKLDIFFKKDKIDYMDFEELCEELSGLRRVHKSGFYEFIKGSYKYYDKNGDSHEAKFVSRFTDDELTIAEFDYPEWMPFSEDLKWCLMIMDLDTKKKLIEAVRYTSLLLRNWGSIPRLTFDMYLETVKWVRAELRKEAKSVVA